MHTFVTGVVRHGGQSWKLTIPSELLVLDAVDWARSQKEWHEDEALSAEEDKDLESAVSAREVAFELDLWLRYPNRVVKSVPLLAMRQTVKPYTVLQNNLLSYVSYLVRRHRPEKEQPFFSFILDIDQCTLCVLPELRAQARHTGPEIAGAILDPNTLQEMAHAACNPVPNTETAQVSHQQTDV